MIKKHYYYLILVILELIVVIFILNEFANNDKAPILIYAVGLVASLGVIGYILGKL